MLDTTIYIFIPLLCGISATWAALKPQPLTRKDHDRHHQHERQGRHPTRILLTPAKTRPRPPNTQRTNWPAHQTSRREPIACSKHRHHARLKKQTTSYAKKNHHHKDMSTLITTPDQKGHRGLKSQRESKTGSARKRPRPPKSEDSTTRGRIKTTTNDTTRRHSPIAKMRPLPTPAQQENP